MLFNSVDYSDKVKIGKYHFNYFTKDNLKYIFEFLSKCKYSDSGITYFGYVGNYISIDDYSLFGKYRYLYKFIDNLLCIFTEDVNTKCLSLFHSPIGECDYKTKRSALRKCIKILYTVNGLEHQSKIINCNSEYLNMLHRQSLHNVNNYSDEFIFETNSLKTLDGKKYKPIRRALNKFKSEYKYEFREYVDSDFADALKVYNLWCEDYKSKIEAYKQEGKTYGTTIWDSDLFIKQLKYRHYMGISIYVLKIDKEIVGISGIADLCEDSSVILFEKCINKYIGITEFMWLEMLNLYPNFKKFECDGDGGSRKSGLYAYKMKFKPTILNPCITVSINKKGEKITERFFNKDE